jgi:hypothetical protein
MRCRWIGPEPRREGKPQNALRKKSTTVSNERFAVVSLINIGRADSI